MSDNIIVVVPDDTYEKYSQLTHVNTLLEQLADTRIELDGVTFIRESEVDEYYG